MEDPDIPCYMKGSYLPDKNFNFEGDRNSKSLSSCVAVREIPGRGKGVVALQDISPGTLLAREKPLIVLPWWVRHTRYPKKEMEKAIFRALDELTDEEEEAFYSLSDSKTLPGQEKTETGIWRTNNFALGRSHQKTHNGLFPALSRFNHSCVPTAEFYWNNFLRRQEIRSIVDIAKGDEIYLCYFTVHVATRDRDARVKYLEDSYGFQCQCSDCSLSGKEVEDNNQSRCQIRELELRIQDLLYEWSSCSSGDSELEGGNSSQKEEKFLNDEDLIQAQKLGIQRLNLMNSLGFKVISKLDAIKLIIDISEDLDDYDTTRHYVDEGIQLANLLYGPETNEYKEWTKKKKR